MPIDVQELADREAIREVRYRFGAALDTRDWEQFAALFTDDATGDFTSVGATGAASPKDAIVGMFRAAFRLPVDRLATQQIISNVLVDVQGDTATSSSYLEGHHRLPGHAGGDDVTLRARYDDHLVRTRDGWRIGRTTLTVISVTGNPAVLTP